MKDFIDSIIHKAGRMVLDADMHSAGVRMKTDARNIVTRYDEQVQTYLFGELQSHNPDIALIGEESSDNTLPRTGEFCIIDPIDGTSNFAQGVKHSCISIAYGSDGKVNMGFVYDPYLDELFFAERGCGASVNGTPITRNNDVDLKHSLVCFGTCPYDLNLTDRVFDLAKLVFRNSLDLRRTGSAALEICYTAANRYDLFFEPILYPWDYAAASLIVTEAGGTVQAFDRGPVALDKRSSIVSGSASAVEDFFALLRENELN